MTMSRCVDIVELDCCQQSTMAMTGQFLDLVIWKTLKRLYTIVGTSVRRLRFITFWQNLKTYTHLLVLAPVRWRFITIYNDRIFRTPYARLVPLNGISLLILAWWFQWCPWFVDWLPSSWLSARSCCPVKVARYNASAIVPKINRFKIDKVLDVVMIDH